jgi:hypothetical protein
VCLVPDSDFAFFTKNPQQLQTLTRRVSLCGVPFSSLCARAAAPLDHHRGFHTTCTHAPSMHCHDANHRSVAPQRAERGAAAAWGEAPTWVRSIACTWTQLRRAIDGLHARQLVSARRTDARRGQPSLGGRTTGLISLEVSCRSNAASSTTTSRRERAASSDDGRRRGDPTAVHP